MVSLPRIGDEVLVDFINGDPDWPIMVGNVNNAASPALYRLPDNKTQSGIRTRSTPGGGPNNYNELRFEDKKGTEEVFLQAEKDFNVLIKNNETKTIGNSLENKIGKTATISAGEQLRLVCGNASIMLDQSGRITIQGSEVFIAGTGTLHLDGLPIQLNMELKV